MQRRLFEFPLREIHTSRNQQVHYCVNCILDINDAEANKFETRIFKKKVRVVLKPGPTVNMLHCPRCHATHFTKDFYRGRNKGYKRL